MTDFSESKIEEIRRKFPANEIDSGIWLGDISSSQDIQALDVLQIKYVLSIMNFQPVGFSEERRIRKHIHAFDTPSMNLIDHFDESFEFIDKALSDGSNILIHCLAGVSRSATIVAAYLMRKYRLTEDEALMKIREKRHFVCPNDGFRKQLRIFYKNKWITPEKDQEKDRPVTIIRNDNDSTSIEYKCKICRQTLFGEIDIVKHELGKGRFDLVSRSSAYKAKRNAENLEKIICESELFTDQLSWLNEIYEKETNDGDILCPNKKCQAKLGRYSLIGEKCCCAAWVNPAYHFHRTKIDRYSPLNELNELLAKKLT